MLHLANRAYIKNTVSRAVLLVSLISVPSAPLHSSCKKDHLVLLKRGKKKKENKKSHIFQWIYCREQFLRPFCWREGNWIYQFLKHARACRKEKGGTETSSQVVSHSWAPISQAGPEEGGQLPSSPCNLVADRKQFCGLNPANSKPSPC